MSLFAWILISSEVVWVCLIISYVSDDNHTEKKNNTQREFIAKNTDLISYVWRYADSLIHEFEVSVNLIHGYDWL